MMASVEGGLRLINNAFFNWALAELEQLHLGIAVCAALLTAYTTLLWKLIELASIQLSGCILSDSIPYTWPINLRTPLLQLDRTLRPRVSFCCKCIWERSLWVFKPTDSTWPFMNFTGKVDTKSMEMFFVEPLVQWQLELEYMRFYRTSLEWLWMSRAWLELMPLAI